MVDFATTNQAKKLLDECIDSRVSLQDKGKLEFSHLFAF